MDKRPSKEELEAAIQRHVEQSAETVKRIPPHHRTILSKFDTQTAPDKSMPDQSPNWEHAKDPNRGIGHRCEIRLVPDGDGYSAYVCELAGVHSQGKTEAEAKVNIEAALKAVLHSYISSGNNIPWSPGKKPTKKGELSHWLVVRV